MKTIIFDLDGTLLNTISDLGHACNHALQTTGLPLHPLEDYRLMVGNGLRRLVERAAPQADANTIDSLVTLCRDYYNDHYADTTKPYTGIPQLLERISNCGIKIAVASNKYQEAVDRIIRHYFPTIPFFAIEGQREGRSIKPDPAIILDIIQNVNSDIEETVMVGDSTVDIETARRAGIKSIAVTWGFCSEEILRNAHPDRIVYHPDEILSSL